MKGEYVMIIKKIKYKDFKGTEREEDFYFHMSKPEVIKWMTTNGNYTLDKVIGRLIKTENVRDLVNEFEYLILNSYGVISLDGISFDKSEENRNRFKNSNAYSELFMELVGDAKKAAEFFNGILPDDLSDAINKAISENPENIPDVLKDYVDDSMDKNKIAQIASQNTVQ